MSFISVDYEREAFLFRMPDGLPVYAHYSFLFTALFITAPLWFQGRLVQHRDRAGPGGDPVSVDPCP
jgi:hypothetical protein